MPILVALGSAIVALLIWYFRFRGPRGVTDLFDAANDARLAARRFGYQMRTNQTPIQSIDDSRLAAAGLLVCVTKDEGTMTHSQEGEIKRQCQHTFNCTASEADEFLAFGRWIVDQDDSHRTWEKLLKQVKYLGGDEALCDIEEMSQAVAKSGRQGVGETAGLISEQIKRWMLH